jgi:hypothetical protein
MTGEEKLVAGFSGRAIAVAAAGWVGGRGADRARAGLAGAGAATAAVTLARIPLPRRNADVAPAHAADPAADAAVAILEASAARATVGRRVRRP